MRWLPNWRERLGWRQKDAELDEEIRAHLRMATADREARGESAEDARASARRELGNPLLIRETTREIWGWARFGRMVRDLRYALRQMRRNPGYTAVAVATLALGLGATTAMFSIVNSVLLRPLSFREPGQLYLARTIPPPEADLTRDFPVNARQFDEWRMRCRSCESAGITQYVDLTYDPGAGGEPQKLLGMRVSHDFLSTLGVEPSLGRGFLPDEELPGNFNKVILTGRLWRGQFEADPAIVGREIQINGRPHTVVGVLPDSLHLPRGDQWGDFAGPNVDPLLFRPLGFDASRADRVGSLNYAAVVRLRPGVSEAQAAQELTSLARQAAGGEADRLSISLMPMREQVTRNSQQALWLLFGMVAVVLLIVCLNVGNLILVRTAGREREAGVRLALGASRAQLFGLVLEEAMGLSVLGGLLGYILAAAALRAFVAAAPVALPRLDEVAMDGRVLLFAGVAVAIATAVCAMVPAWKLAATAPLGVLKSGAVSTTMGRGSARLREWMTGVEVALSAVLLVAGGLLGTSFLRVLQTDRGFAVEHVFAQDVSFANPKYDQDTRRRFLRDLVPQLAAIPGVRYAGAVNRLPLRGEEWSDSLRDPNQPEPPLEMQTLANFRFVSPGYFEAMGIELKQGRFLELRDLNRPVAVVSKAAADALWPGLDPIGRQVRGAAAEGGRATLEVVGVVGEVPAISLEQTPPLMVYEHYWRMGPPGMTLVVRTEGDSAQAMSAVRAILARADPSMALPAAEPMADVVNATLSARRFQVYLVIGFAAAALLLAALGVYGVISFAVSRRTQELGIRTALGAGPGTLAAMVVRQGMMPVIAGLAAGLVAALLLGQFIASELYGVAPDDPLTMAVAGVVLLAAGGAACWLPARRATRIDPVRALRFE